MIISELCKTIFGSSKDDPLGIGTLVSIEKSVDAEASLFFKVTFIDDPPVFDKVPAITRDLLLAVKIVVSELFEIATVASEKLFAIYYPPKAIAKGIELSAAAIVTVSLPPSLVSVKVMFDPAVSLASNNPAVVSFADTLTEDDPEAAAAAELAAAVADVAALVAEVAAAVAEDAAAVADDAALVACVDAVLADVDALDACVEAEDAEVAAAVADVEAAEAEVAALDAEVVAAPASTIKSYFAELALEVSGCDPEDV